MQSHYTLRPSRNYLWLILSLCVLLPLAISRLPIALGWGILGSMLAVMSCLFVGVRDGRLRLANSCVAFRLEGEKGITLIQRNGKHVSGSISAGGLVAPSLVLLNIGLDGRGRRSLLLLPDSMNREAFRRLRVVLKWSR